MSTTTTTPRPVRLGLRENLAQFSLLVGVNALVGGMIGQERTVLPLLAFSAAATRIPLATLGLLQYIGPTLQFLIGVFVYDEPMPPSRLVGFVMVWVALALFTAEGLRHRRRHVVPTSSA